MPEGHVAHRLARELNGRFSGLAVQVTSPQGRFAEAATLDRTVLEQAEAVGKHLLVDFGERGSVWIHLGLIGKLAVGPDVPPPSPQTVRLRVDDGEWEEQRIFCVAAANGRYFGGSTLMALGDDEAALPELTRAAELRPDVAQPI